MADATIETTIATSRVPIVVSLGSIFSEAKIDLEFHTMAKRFAVLSDSLKVAFEFFSEELKLQYKPDGYRYYLTFEDTPLDFTLPVGVLFDSLATELPWSLKMHIVEKLPVKMFDYNTYEKLLNTRIKESYYIRYGKRFPGLTNEYERIIVNAAQKSDEESVREFWNCLRETFREKDIQRFPIKLVLPDQNAIPLYLKSDLCPTLASLAGAPQIPAKYRGKIGPEYTLIIHGIAPPADTPLNWLVEHFCHADGFVYIALAANGKLVSTD
eukprot:TRINITY_DN3608_c0_g1_i1.p1 TRINITY_DN3608_c0_g1~~TRINITY_DN3608_c0_g1_i1.p1  ORF type:complete len:290 (+),score=106.35 TRINITY_DN3608_c0_g1_i1:64-870(+)